MLLAFANGEVQAIAIQVLVDSQGATLLVDMILNR